MLKMMNFQMMFMMLNNPNPMSILIMINTFTMNMATMTFIITMNYWMSMIAIITYIGGLMILFLYIISLMPNTKQKWSNINMMSAMSLMLTIMWMSYNTFTNKSPLKTISMSYLNNTWNLIMTIIIIMMMTQTASKIILLPFKTMKSTY